MMWPWGRWKNQGERSGQFILNRLGIVLTAQLSADGLELAESLSSWDK